MRQSRKKIATVFYMIIQLYLVVILYSNKGNISHRLIVNSDPVVSYCSKESDSRGYHQSVISYSLYGNFSDPKHFRRYTGAIKYILSNISQVYPGAYQSLIA